MYLNSHKKRSKLLVVVILSSKLLICSLRRGISWIPSITLYFCIYFLQISKMFFLIRLTTIRKSKIKSVWDSSHGRNFFRPWLMSNPLFFVWLSLDFWLRFPFSFFAIFVKKIMRYFLLLYFLFFYNYVNSQCDEKKS